MLCFVMRLFNNINIQQLVFIDVDLTDLSDGWWHGHLSGVRCVLFAYGPLMLLSSQYYNTSSSLCLTD